MTFKVNNKIAQIARLRVAGISDERICQMFGMTRSGLSRIVVLPEYVQEEESIMNGTISKMDEALAGRAEEMKKEFRVGVPAAMRALLETVSQRRDLRARMAAAKELLDRDPDRTFTRQEANPGDNYSRPQIPTGVLDAVANEADKFGVSVTEKVKSSVN